MKRDMDLARKILLEIEKHSSYAGFFDLGKIEGYDANEVSYHVMLLDGAGLIVAHDLSTFTSKDWQPTRLTWSGHEFLDASRDDGRWEKAKSMISSKGGTMVFDIVKEVLIQLMKGQVLGTT